MRKCNCDIATGECQGPLECKAVKCLPALVKALAEIDRYSLVIESAVRNQDSGNYASVLAALKEGRAALAAYREALK